MKNYLIVIEYGTDNCSAFSPDVPGCVATGKNVEDTLINMKSALLFHLEGLDDTPEPLGLLHHLNAGEFDPDKIEEKYFITHV